LFIPLSGERFDGHEYAAQAFAAGAAAVLWAQDRPVPAELAGKPLVVVTDPLSALQRLAASYRDQLPVRVIGITGSNGKTTTKDLVASALGAFFRVHKTEGNLNNHIGLPLTVLGLAEDTDFAVLEMGMSGFGEIELLSGIARPDAAVITNIGEAHMLQLGSREGIAKAKLEIVSGLKPGGLLLINGDEPLLRGALQHLALPERTEVRTFGLTAANDWTVADAVVGAADSSFTVRSPLAQFAAGFRIPVPGKHNISNALAAIALAVRFGVPEERIREGLSSVKLTGMRIETVAAYNGATVLNDAYNANPTAVKAAIALVSELSGYRRKWLVLADMLELGPDEERLHREVGETILPEGADCVITFGNLSRHTMAGAAERFPADAVRHFDDKEQLKAWLREAVKPEDLVLVKGSRGMRMEEIVQALER
jgi:UDP-N-acetylmuramoyl-tripeptide--D-alanyl-D-alanine ligase